jgi:hypothetical protein
MANEPEEGCIPVLRDTFGFHPLAIDDALEESHVPKVDVPLSGATWGCIRSRGRRAAFHQRTGPFPGPWSYDPYSSWDVFVDAKAQVDVSETFLEVGAFN